MGARMRAILHDLNKHGPSKMREIILRTEGIDELPSREMTKKLYSYTRSSMVRLMIQGFVECLDDNVYKVTEKGRTYYMNHFLTRK